jgi:5-methylcytosine-specific restriction endonuclease McrA
MMFPKSVRLIDEAVLEKRRRELCWVCGDPESQASHIKTRGSGGPDTIWNVVAHCQRCHNEWGSSWVKFLKKHRTFAFRLKLLGWDWSSGRLKHPGLEKE